MFAHAQLRHDANWVFGKGCGIDFNVSGNPVAFAPASDNNEAAASISDKNGQLLLYLSCPTNQLGQIKNIANDTILNGDSINIYFSATNGAVFLPIGTNADSIIFFHTGLDANCGFVRCLRLYYSLIVKDENGRWLAIQKNQVLLANPVEEAISLVKHSNGIDWWLFIHGERADHPDSCSNKYFRFLVQKDTILGPYEQEVTGERCASMSFGGEISISTNGKYLAKAVYEDGKTFIYSINRCTGMLSLLHEIIGDLDNYGVCIYGNYIYISGLEPLGGTIYQYSLQAPNVNASRKIIYTNSATDYGIGQLEAGGQYVFVTFLYIGTDSILSRRYKRHLSAIEYPEMDSARIKHEFLYLGDSAKTDYGLPNFPNYNLGPEGVYLVTAGKDTTLCSNTNSMGVTIGVPPVPNITYLWQPATGLSATNTAQPIANPNQSIWYYLTATDTTSTSCAVNTDSVYVEVRTCVGITETSSLQAKLYPNPTTRAATVELPVTNGGMFTLFNLLGQRVLETPLTGKSTDLS